MYVQVSLLNGFAAPLLYKIPSHIIASDLVGQIVSVPLRNTVTPAIVINQFTYLNQPPTFEIKEFVALEPFPQDHHYNQFIDYLSHAYQVPRVHFVKRVRQFVIEKTEKKTDAPINTSKNLPRKEIILTAEQQTVCNFVIPYLHAPRFMPTLMHGVTGSGKTEVYKQLIIQTIGAGKTVVLLLPEVTLALQFQKLLHQQLPDSITMIGFHSATNVKEKRMLWQRLLEQKPTLIIGVHLPVLLPIAQLGLIIIDEEHEHGYQEKRHPKVHTRHAAIERARIAQIPILLGSATPSLSSLYLVKTERWKFFQLKNRFAGKLPAVQTVFLTNGSKRTSFWISSELADAITDRLAKKEQVIIFLNRRGFSFFVQCKQCSFIFTCTDCSVSLTLHVGETLHCHYCGIQQSLPQQCPGCKTDSTNFLKKGIGTQHIVQIVQKMFPAARIARADMDITAKKKTWQQTVHDFENNNLDILVGTQTVTKGFHFPNVTLVGIIWADLNLHFPVFNATEHTLQQLIQVAGRAGRGSKESLVIIQAMVDHHVYQYLNEIDYLQFYRSEIEKRMMLSYPPCGVLVEIEIKNTNEQLLAQEAPLLAQELEQHAKKSAAPVIILGPAKPPVHKIQGVHAQTLFLKSADLAALTALFTRVNKKRYTSKLFFTPVF
jgi:primosomal protein N' (replication factor Y)